MSSLRLNHLLTGPGDRSRNLEVIIDQVLPYDSEESLLLLKIPTLADRAYLRAVRGRVTNEDIIESMDFASFMPGELPRSVRMATLSDYITNIFMTALIESSMWTSRHRSEREKRSAQATRLVRKAPPDDDEQSTSRDRSNAATISELADELASGIRAAFAEEEMKNLLDVNSEGLRQSADESIDELLQECLNGLNRIVRIVTRHAGLELESVRAEHGFSRTLPAESWEMVRSKARGALGGLDPVVLVPTARSAPERPFYSEIRKENLRSSLSAIHYLGPIRDIDVEVSGTRTRRSVGRRGEYCADVLQREAREKLVSPPVPPDNESLRETAAFIDVLNSWLQYLQLAKNVEVEDHGRYKAGIKVCPLKGEGVAVPVSSVGVGVAQVLPIIVQCLLADPGRSLVVIEQPELHLHPSLEVKLADFFVACARSGRQIFIETHSEHLINRLRLAIAQDDSGDTRDLVSVLFAQQDQTTGITEYRNAVINELGGIEGDGWPPNFIDLSTDQGLALLKEAVARRQRMASANQIDDDDF